MSQEYNGYDERHILSDQQLQCIKEEDNESYNTTFQSQKLKSSLDDMESVRSIVNNIKDQPRQQESAYQYNPENITVRNSTFQKRKPQDIKIYDVTSDSSPERPERPERLAPEKPKEEIKLRSKFAQKLLEQEKTRNNSQRVQQQPKFVQKPQKEQYSQSVSPRQASRTSYLVQKQQMLQHQQSPCQPPHQRHPIRETIVRETIVDREPKVVISPSYITPKPPLRSTTTHGFASLIHQCLATQQELLTLNLIRTQTPVYIDFKKYQNSNSPDLESKFMEDIVMQNKWFAKNVIQLISELSKYKLSEPETPLSAMHTQSSKNLLSTQDNQKGNDEIIIQRKNDEISKKSEEIRIKIDEIYKKNEEIRLKNEELNEKNELIDQKNGEIRVQNEELIKLNEEIQMQIKEIQIKNDQIQKKDEELKRKQEILEKQSSKIGNLILENDNLNADLVAKDSEIKKMISDLQNANTNKQNESLIEDLKSTHEEEIASLIRDFDDVKQANHSLSLELDFLRDKNAEYFEDLSKIQSMFTKMKLCQEKMEKLEADKKQFYEESSHPLNGSLNILISQNNKLKLEKQKLKKVIESLVQDKNQSKNWKTLVEKLVSKLEHRFTDKEAFKQSLYSELEKAEPLLDELFAHHLPTLLDSCTQFVASTYCSQPSQTLVSHSSSNSSYTQTDLPDFEGTEFSKPIFRKLLEDQMKQTTQLQIENQTLLESQKSMKKKMQKMDEQTTKLEKFYQKMKNKKYRNCGTQADPNEEYKRKILQEVLNTSNQRWEEEANLEINGDEISSFYINQSSTMGKDTHRTLMDKDSDSTISKFAKDKETDCLINKNLR